jgi:hypothetical protein
MISILKMGTVPEQKSAKLYQKTCSVCGTVVECTEADGEPMDLDIDTMYCIPVFNIKCPVCHSWLTIKLD